MEGFEDLRETLVGALEPLQSHARSSRGGRREIMIELLDVVRAGYKRSARTARAYHLALMELAGRLPPVRLAA
jgi:hypothetical protein